MHEELIKLATNYRFIFGFIILCSFILIVSHYVNVLVLLFIQFFPET